MPYILKMILKGYIEKSIFYKEETNWGIYILKTDDNNKVTIKGSIPRIYDAKKLELECEVENNLKYGIQYKIISAKILPVTTNYEIKKYLASDVFKGIGEVTADRLIAAFGENTLEIIKNKPELLSTIKGITEKKALQMQKEARYSENIEDSLKYLMGHGITISQAYKIINLYKDSTVSIVSQNPYKLISDFEGIGFIKADQIAQNVGIPKDSIMRLEKLIIYILETFSQRTGCTTILFENLKAEFLKYSGLNINSKTVELFEKALLNLKNIKEIVENKRDDNTYISDSRMYYMEKQISEKLFSLNNSIQSEIPNIEKLINMFELKNNINMTDQQKKAVINSLNSSVSIITGGPGTGKTTITKCIIEILKKNNFNIAQAAPTGRAAKRMEESTNFESKTIHRLLNVQYDGSYAYNEFNKLSCDVLIIDEFSMCDTVIVFKLLKALENDTKLILIGDKDQLQSVSPGNILEDLINSNQFVVSYLDFIFRQKEGSDIKEIAKKINLREKITLNNYRFLDNEVVFIETEEVEEMKKKLVKLITDEIPKKYNCSSYDIQILSPNKTRESGSDEINKIIQEVVNPPNESKNSIVYQENIFRIGDKVIHTKNDYSLEWYQRYNDLEERGAGIFNGEIGIIKEITDQKIIVEYEDFKIAEYKTREQKSSLKLAYAISIHKSQGSEFDIVIMPIVQDNPITNNSKVLYTGITRAKKVVYLLTNQKKFNSALSAKRTIKRLTQLKWLLQY